MASLQKEKAPKRPFFYRSVEDTNQDDDDDSTSPTSVCTHTVSFQGKLNKGSTRGEWASQRKSFVVESPSVIPVSSREESIRSICRVACGSIKPGFPGACAVLLDVKNMHFLGEMPYRVSWKADSTRYLMLIHNENEVYMVDRDNSVFKVSNMVFPLLEDLEKRLTNTLVDGEVVFYDVDGNSHPCYVIYDIVMIKGRRDIARKNHSKRLECIDKEIMKPREALAKANKLDTSLEPFGIRLKPFWKVCEAQMILEKYAPSLIPETDGLTFFPDCEDEGMLNHDGKIIKCCWDFVRNQWKFIRVRTDRSYPNSVQTAKNNFAAILNPVTKQDLLEICNKKRWPQSGMVDIDRKRPSLDGSDEEGQLMSPPGKRLQQ